MADLPDAVLEMSRAPQLDIEIRRGATHQFRTRVKVSDTAVDNAGWVVVSELTGLAGDVLATWDSTLLTPSSDGWVKSVMSAAATSALAFPVNVKADASGLLRGVIGRYDQLVTDAAGNTAFVRWGHVVLVGLD